MRLRGLTVAAGAAAATLLLAGCGGSGGGHLPGTDGQSQGATHGTKTNDGDPRSAANKAAHAPEQQLPDGFDRGNGWAVRSSDRLSKPAISAHAGAVAFLAAENGSDSVHVQARDLKSGDVRWSSGALQPLRDPQYGLPFDTRLVTVSKDGKDYAVVIAAGDTGGDSVSKPTSLMRLTVFALDASGENVQPLRTVDLPRADLSVDDLVVQANDATVVVPKDKGAVAVDVSTGSVTTYTEAQVKAPANAPGCRDSIADCDLLPHVVGVSAGGPVVNGESSFWRSGTGGWYSANVQPPQVAKEYQTAQITGVGGSHLVSVWDAQDGLAFDKVVDVSDPASGAVTASVLCDGDDSTPITSPDGRYLAAGTAVFDLTAKKGYCFAETPQRNLLKVQSVDGDHGVAYATSSDSPGSTGAARITLSNGQSQPLPNGTIVPQQVADGVGMFTESQPDGFTATFYPMR